MGLLWDSDLLRATLLLVKAQVANVILCTSSGRREGRRKEGGHLLL